MQTLVFHVALFMVIYAVMTTLQLLLKTGANVASRCRGKLEERTRSLRLRRSSLQGSLLCPSPTAGLRYHVRPFC